MKLGLSAVFLGLECHLHVHEELFTNWLTIAVPACTELWPIQSSDQEAVRRSYVSEITHVSSNYYNSNLL